MNHDHTTPFVGAIGTGVSLATAHDAIGLLVGVATLGYVLTKWLREALALRRDARAENSQDKRQRLLDL